MSKLILTRCVTERIILHTADGPITVIIAKVQGKRVKVGIEAPASVKIVRSELESETK